MLLIIMFYYRPIFWIFKIENPQGTEVIERLGGEVNNYRNQLTIVLSASF